MEVLLDTSFIVSCIRKKIDFISQLEELGFKIIFPKEVLEELKDLKNSPEESRADRESINLALRMFEDKDVKKMKLGSRTTDEGLIHKGKEGYYIATLDSSIKRLVPNKVVIFDAQKSVGVERT